MMATLLQLYVACLACGVICGAGAFVCGVRMAKQKPELDPFTEIKIQSTTIAPVTLRMSHTIPEELYFALAAKFPQAFPEWITEKIIERNAEQIAKLCSLSSSASGPHGERVFVIELTIVPGQKEIQNG